MKYFISFLLLFCSFYNCTSNDSIEINKNDYLIFGHFYGMCVGKSCVTNYKLTANTLYVDSKKDYSHSEFDFLALPNDKFEQIKDLMDFIPSKLLNVKESVLGCPDCYDQGGIFIQLSKNGLVKSWQIDTNRDDVPIYLHNFLDKINEKITLLNK